MVVVIVPCRSKIFGPFPTVMRSWMIATLRLGNARLTLKLEA
jgi:hypothetical protein